MKIGRLDRRIVIESRTDTVDSVGQPVPTWSEFLRDIPAAYEPEVGKQFFDAQAISVENPARFRMRYRSDIDERMRVQFETKIWDIASVVEGKGRHQELYLYCHTGMTEG